MPVEEATDRPPQREDPDRTERGLLALRLGDVRFGVWVDEALEILRTPPISRLPLADPEVAGVTSVRGEVVPVLDLGVRLLGAPARRPGLLVLVRGPDQAAPLGLLVDDVETLLTVAEERLAEAPEASRAALPAEFVRGVVLPEEGGVVTILDLERATRPPRADPNED